MADLLSDIEAYIKGASKIVFPFFKDHIEDKPDTAIALYEYTGQSPTAQVEGVLRSVQVVVRSKSPAEAKHCINEIYKLLLTEDSVVDFTASRWALVSLRQPPFKMKVDEKGRVYYVFNAGITTYLD